MFKKKLRYTLEMKKWKWEAYMYSMHSIIPFINNDIKRAKLSDNRFDRTNWYAFTNYGTAIMKFGEDYEEEEN